MENTNDKYSNRVAVKVILLSQLLAEAIDEAESTTFYNHSLKNLLNKVVQKLEPFNRTNYDSIYDDDVADSIDVLNTIVDELTHCKVENFNSIEHYNLYLVTKSDGTSVKVKSTLNPEDFRKAYSTQFSKQ